jgi:multicomponent Na+:H+ antiporter subunit E
MIAYVFNLMLMLAWGAITGLFSLGNLAVGFVLGYLIIAFTLTGEERFAKYVRKVPRFGLFIGYFFKALVMSNLRVAYDVLTPTHLMKPAVIRMPLEARTPGEITVLANLISLTPGTLSLDVDEDANILYVHVMYLDGEDVTLAELKDMERRVLELLR